MRLNLGCGFNMMDGYLNCDIDEGVSPDMVVDLAKALPFVDDSVVSVYSSHTLEHLDKDTLINTTLPEIWRVCRHGAELKIIVPYMFSQNVLNHKTFFNEDTFNNWCKEDYDSSDTYPFNFSFMLEGIDISYNKHPLSFLMPEKLKKALLGVEITANMRVLK